MTSASPPAEAQTIVSAENLELRFGDAPILQRLGFSIQAGQFLAVVGPSGCGKTSLLRILAGLTQPTAGKLEFDRQLRRSYVFQEPNLLDWRTALGNVHLPLELQREEGSEPKSDGRQRCLAALQRVGLTAADAEKYPRALSGGMRMRVSLARALINEPQLLLLDEPFAAVDDLTRQRLNQQLHSLWIDSAWTGILVTHNIAEAVLLSERCWLMTGRDTESPLEEFAIDRPTSDDRPVTTDDLLDWKSSRQFTAQVAAISQRLAEAAEAENGEASHE